MSTQWTDDFVICPRCRSIADASLGAFTSCSRCGNFWKPKAREAKAPVPAGGGRR
jgi:hypothetical protein